MRCKNTSEIITEIDKSEFFEIISKDVKNEKINFHIFDT